MHKSFQEIVDKVILSKEREVIRLASIQQVNKKGNFILSTQLKNLIVEKVCVATELWITSLSRVQEQNSVLLLLKYFALKRHHSF